VTRDKFLAKCRVAGLAVRMFPEPPIVRVLGQTDRYTVEEKDGQAVLRWKRHGQIQQRVISGVEDAQTTITLMQRRPL